MKLMVTFFELGDAWFKLSFPCLIINQKALKRKFEYFYELIVSTGKSD
jgi:hypothetical protein